MTRLLDLGERVEKATHIEVEAEPRYWEDATVNGETDDDGSLMPGGDGKLWKVRIDLDAGRIEDWPAGTTARIHYKVCDQGLYWLADSAGNRIAQYRSDYVPGAFLCHGNQGYGDYIILNVEPDGTIGGYQRPPINHEEWRTLDTPARAAMSEVGLHQRG